jgi:hypothetical protein
MENEKIKKVKETIARLENAMRNTRRKELMLGFSLEEVFNELLDEWNEAQDELRELERE